jgi:hypothetical protein
MATVVIHKVSQVVTDTMVVVVVQVLLPTLQMSPQLHTTQPMVLQVQHGTRSSPTVAVAAAAVVGTQVERLAHEELVAVLAVVLVQVRLKVL